MIRALRSSQPISSPVCVHGLAAVGTVGVVLGAPGSAHAFPGHLPLVPNSDVFGCQTCHNNPQGGLGCGPSTSYPDWSPSLGSCMNHFGVAFAANGYVWNATLRDGDADGDGRSNGYELFYFETSVGADDDTWDAFVTLPGFDGFNHTDPVDAFHYEEVNRDECLVQVGSPPRDYANCSTVATTCVNNNDTGTAALPPGSPYFGFTCSCSSGYSGNGRVDVVGDGYPDSGANGCTDDNECLTATRCRQDFGGGSVNSCMNNAGSYECICGEGWSETGSGLSQTCTDLDECTDATRCNENVGHGTCSNTEGGYDCTCSTGYTVQDDGTLSETCVDDNECVDGTRCNAHISYGVCDNTDGAYDCTCNAGYTVQDDGTFSETCVDDNECDLATRCNAHLGFGTCQNTTGGYSCTCTLGYSKQDAGTLAETCVVDDECLTGMDDCDANAFCTNEDPGYRCTCFPGYTGDGHTSGTGCTQISGCDAGRCGADGGTTPRGSSGSNCRASKANPTPWAVGVLLLVATLRTRGRRKTR